MVREFMLMALAVMTACGAPEIGSRHPEPVSSNEEPERRILGLTPVPSDGAGNAGGADFDDAPVTDPEWAIRKDDPDYWLEALVFGVADIDRSESRERELTQPSGPETAAETGFTGTEGTGTP